MIGKIVKYETKALLSESEIWYGLVVGFTDYGAYLVNWIKWGNKNMLKSDIRDQAYPMFKESVEIL